MRPGDCAFVIYNRTPHALEIRIGTERSTAPIGAINQGESLNSSAPCTQGWAWVYGLPIPESVGARVRFPFVVTSVELKRDARVNVELLWPGGASPGPLRVP